VTADKGVGMERGLGSHHKRKRRGKQTAIRFTREGMILNEYSPNPVYFLAFYPYPERAASCNHKDEHGCIKGRLLQRKSIALTISRLTSKCFCLDTFYDSLRVVG
jgi:hypothetical protein